MSTLIYSIIFKVIKLLCHKKGIKIWYRNSLFFKKIILFKSDIDITVFGKNRNDVNLVCQRIKKLKSLFPLIGEINSYTEEDLLLTKKFNYFELARDPLLTDNLSFIPSKTIEQKIVFLFKMYQANSKKVFNQIKWDFYCNHINESSCHNFTDVKNLLEALIKVQGSSLENGFYILNIINEMEDAIKNSSLNFIGLRLRSLKSDEKELLNALLSWELQGVISQKHQYSDKDIASHLLNIDRMLDFIKDNPPLIYPIRRVAGYE